MAEILHQFHIAAPAPRVFQALSNRDGLAQWWTRDVVAEDAVGSVARFGFGRRQVVFRMLILELKPPVSVRWRCLGGHPEWRETEISFTLNPVDDGTTLAFAHRGWIATQGIFAVCNFDWARYLMSLKAYLEQGRGAPHPG